MNILLLAKKVIRKILYIIKNILPKKLHTWKHNKIVNPITKGQIKKLRPKTIFDIGAGDGFYGKLIRKVNKKAHITAVEANTEYISSFGLHSIYDNVINANIIEVIGEIKGDLIIFGDILEHLKKEDMQYVLRTAARNFKNVIVNSPFEFQEHNHTCTFEIHRCGLNETDFYEFKNYKFTHFKDEKMFNCIITRTLESV